MKTYEIILNTGTKISTDAENIEAAKALVCSMAGVPVSAVQSWRVIPTAKQVKRTKSLMRGL